MLWLILLCFGVLVWLTYRLGDQLFSPWVGLVAALVVLTRPALERDALLGYQDTAFAALIVGAVLLEAQRSRRGAPVLVLLVLAGLMRPEAWVLGGLYVLWLWPALSARRRAWFAGLALAAPALWALSDWAVTGDALHSLHGTADLAEAVDRRRRPEQAPYWTAQYYGYVLREPLVIGIPVGLFFAWRQRLRGAVLPLVVVVVMTVVFMAGSLFGLPLIGRYVRTPAVLLTLFYGLSRVRVPDAPGRPRPHALDDRRRADRRPVDRLRAVAARDARHTARPDRARRTGLRGPARGRRGTAGAGRGGGLRRDDHERRPAADPAPALLARHGARHRVDHDGGRQPAAAGAAAPARHAADAAAVPELVP